MIQSEKGQSYILQKVDFIVIKTGNKQKIHFWTIWFIFCKKIQMHGQKTYDILEIKETQYNEIEDDITGCRKRRIKDECGCK